jgi:hypothetical protein
VSVGSFATPLASSEVRNLFDANYTTLSVLNVAGSNARVLFPGAPRSVCTGVRYSF